MAAGKKQFIRRRSRVRRAVKKAANGRPRLTVFRAQKNIHAQLVDDVKGVTILSASTLEKDLKGKFKSGAGVKAAEEVGKLVAERAAKAGITDIVFDRSGYIYHGRVKALADAARGGGLKF